mmetsp:Transcript_17919/g.31949  ORF Transcript_17919/g.31949 Transcript_17919/m.31949 type:complete len:306 (+) Transcript_17919:145-1062(+)
MAAPALTLSSIRKCLSLQLDLRSQLRFELRFQRRLYRCQVLDRNRRRALTNLNTLSCQRLSRFAQLHWLLLSPACAISRQLLARLDQLFRFFGNLPLSVAHVVKCGVGVAGRQPQGLAPFPEALRSNLHDKLVIPPVGLLLGLAVLTTRLALAFQPTSDPALCTLALQLKHRPVVEVSEARQCGDDGLSVVANGGHDGVALEVEASQVGHRLHHLHQLLLRAVNSVVGQIKHGEGLALGHMLDGLHAGEAVVGDEQRAQLCEVRQALQAADVVVAQVQRVQLLNPLQPVDLPNHILLRKQATKLR